MQNKNGRDILRGIVSRQKLGRVGSRSRSGCPSRFIPTFGTGRDHCPRISETKIEENQDIPRLSPLIFSNLETKSWEKSRTLLTLPDFEPKSRGQSGRSRLYPIFCQDRDELASSIPTVPMHRGHPLIPLMQALSHVILG